MSVQVRDSVQWLSTSDISYLNSRFGNAPIDVRIIVENVQQSSLEIDAHNWVSPHSIVIGISPASHLTVIRFGNATGIKIPDEHSIAIAGNVYFKSGQIRQGLEAIVLRAKASSQSSIAISTASQPVVITEQQGLSAGTWIMIALGFACLVGFIVWMVRKQKKDRDSFERALQDNQLETSELRHTNIERSEEDDFDRRLNPAIRSRIICKPAPDLQPQKIVINNPAPIIVNQQQPIVMNNAPFIVGNPYMYGTPSYNYYNSNNGIMEGFILGEMLSDRREIIHEREVIREYPSNGSSDNGGSSSNWDSGSDNSSSNDSGGSTSSWDSGSGSSDSGSSSWDSGSSGSGSSDSGSGGDSSW